MKQKHLTYIVCPETRAKLELISLAKEDDHIMAGILLTNKTWYPIIGGVPRMMVGELKVILLQFHHLFFERWKSQLPNHVKSEWQKAIKKIPNFDAFLAHQNKTAERFAFEWHYIYRENNFERNNFFHFLSPFIKEKDLISQTTLDVGCGSGRFTKWAALSGTKVSFGCDLGETVEVAFVMTRHLPNVCIIQADIYNLPFLNSFNLVYSIGVIHHLPRPQIGFSGLSKFLKKNGKLLIWVYNRRGNARAIYFYEPLRALVKHLPPAVLLKLSYIPALAVHGINVVQKYVARSGGKKWVKSMPFYYYTNLPFNMKLNDAFDVLATPKSNYYLKEEIVEWFRSSRLTNVKHYEHPEAGITCIGEYET